MQDLTNYCRRSEARLSLAGGSIAASSGKLVKRISYKDARLYPITGLKYLDGLTIGHFLGPCLVCLANVKERQHVAVILFVHAMDVVCQRHPHRYRGDWLHAV